jgi:hypothetical protein
MDDELACTYGGKGRTFDQRDVLKTSHDQSTAKQDGAAARKERLRTLSRRFSQAMFDSMETLPADAIGPRVGSVKPLTK